MTYQEYIKLLMDELENECGSSATKPAVLSDKRNSKETNNLIDKLTEVLRLINKEKVKAADEVNQTKLKFKVPHRLNPINATTTRIKGAPIVRIRNKSLKTKSLQRVG